MKIKYKILWIDDNLDGIKNFQDNFKDKLKNLGFELYVVEKSSLTSDELAALKNQLSTYNPYDIIIFDYDLGSNATGNGDNIAHELRTSIYTDMIFYSGTRGAELREILYDKKIEGVYTVNRSDFIDEAWPIVEDQIKRICDINSMRGVILDEMSKIDLAMREKYQTKFEDLADDKKNTQLEKYKKKLDDRKEAIEKQKNDCTTESFSDDIMNPIKIEFNIIRTRLKSILDNDLYGESGELKSKQDLRNKFAHNMAEFDEEKGTVRLNGFNESYGFKEFTDIRIALIKLYNEIKKP